MIAIGPIYWIVNRSSKYYDYYDCKDFNGIMKLSNCIWYCYGSMVQQGGDTLPLAISGRILIGFWWIFVIVTVTTYSGNLVALLTFPKIVQPIENAHDLMNTWGMNWGMDGSSSLTEIAKTIQYGDLKLLREDMIFFDFEEDKQKIYDDVSAGQLGFLMKRHEARLWISAEYASTKSCGMHIAKDSVYQSPIHLMAKKNSLDDAIIAEFNRQ